MFEYNLKYVLVVVCLLVVSGVSKVSSSVTENDDTISNSNSHMSNNGDGVESFDVNKNLLELGDHIVANKQSVNLLDPISLLTKQLSVEISKLDTKNYHLVFTHSFKNMQQSQKYYLIALLSSIVSNLHELNDILNEIISENVEINEYLIRKYDNVANTKRSFNRWRVQETPQKHELQYH